MQSELFGKLSTEEEEEEECSVSGQIPLQVASGFVWWPFVLIRDEAVRGECNSEGHLMDYANAIDLQG